MSLICPAGSREPQSIFLPGVIDDELAAAREQSAAVDPFVSGFGAGFGLERRAGRRNILKGTLEHFAISC
jgi:hypothetical protein